MMFKEGGEKMTTGYKLGFQTVRVNTHGKAKKIINALRKAGRHACLEPFTVGVCKTDYIVFYWTRRGVI